MKYIAHVRMEGTVYWVTTHWYQWRGKT